MKEYRLDFTNAVENCCRFFSSEVAPFKIHVKGHSRTVCVIVMKTREQSRKFVGLYAGAVMFPG